MAFVHTLLWLAGLISPTPTVPEALACGGCRPTTAHIRAVAAQSCPRPPGIDAPNRWLVVTFARDDGAETSPRVVIRTESLLHRSGTLRGTDVSTSVITAIAADSGYPLGCEYVVGDGQRVYQRRWSIIEACVCPAPATSATRLSPRRVHKQRI